MNPEFVDAVGSVTERVFKTMIALEPVRKNPTGIVIPKTLYDVTSIVGITGSVVGTISVQFKKALAIKVTANMLQSEVPDLNDDVRDAIGEVGNMIAGALKTELANKGINFDISIPTVVMGPGHSIGHVPGAESVFFPFGVESDSFVVTVSLKN